MPAEKPLFIDEAACGRLLDEKTSFRLAKEVFTLIARGKARMPPKIYLSLPKPPGSDFRAMPGYLEHGGRAACGIKWVSVFPDNASLKIPTVNATILLNSHRTGELLAVLEAGVITAVRTAACAALAARHLANPRPAVLGIVGAGLQAEYQLQALLSEFKFDEIRVWGYGKREASRFCGRLSGLHDNLLACDDLKKCVSDADLIVTCTPSRKPILKKSWVKRGAHINAIGADAAGKEELEPALVLAGKVIVDEWEQASHSGEINVPVSQKLFSKKNLHAEFSQIVTGKKIGRASKKEITIFDSTGLAVLDIHFAQYVYEHSR